MKILHLTLKKKWFDMIASGVKREEYREVKAYWDSRLFNKHYDAIKFRNGYKKDAPSFLIELKDIYFSVGIANWGAPKNEIVYVLKLGNIIDS